MTTTDGARISPTAHYTAFVWYRHGLSHPALVTPLGRRLFWTLRPGNALLEWVGRPSLDSMLLARHRTIDRLIAGAIESGAVGQVVEVAAGFSPRGFQFARRYPGLRYLETDLPAQADAKRRILDDAGLRAPGHEVVALDALKDASFDDLLQHLDPTVGTVLITEGLLNYFERGAVDGMWRRFARFLARFPKGLYLSDLNLAGDVEGQFTARAFRHLLGVFARGRIHLHHPDPPAVVAALVDAGFARAEVHAPAERTLVRVLEARVGD
jgi:O-methyltransferase involved in polyketide biosynthesis